MNRKVKLSHKRQPPFIRSPATASIQTKKPKKSVRFRESGSLEDVRLFLKSEMPIACQSDPICSLKRYLNCPNWSSRASGPVAMEEVELVDGCEILGSCQVANLAYDKQVKIRYTLDDWVSFKEVNASFKESITDHWDRFTFKIECTHVRHLHLAVQYKVAGREFWDNNLDQNYQLDIAAQIVDDEGSSSSSDDELAEVLWAPTFNCLDQRKFTHNPLLRHIALI
ncbi:unnamed protein product [Rhizopus stolonifer]